MQDVISPIVFEAAYSLAEHVTGEEERELPALTPVLRWKKGQKIAQKNQVRTLKPPVRTQAGQVYIWQESHTALAAWGTEAKAHPLWGIPFPIHKMMNLMTLGVASNNRVI